MLSKTLFAPGHLELLGGEVISTGIWDEYLLSSSSLSKRTEGPEADNNQTSTNTLQNSTKANAVTVVH